MLLLLLALLSPLQAPTQPPLRESLETIQRELQAIIDRLPSGVAVPQGGDLQKALDAGGTITLPLGGSFTAARFIITRSGTVVHCQGAAVIATTGPAFWIKPGTHDVTLDGCVTTSGWNGAVILCGDNDATTQGRAALVPQRIHLRNLIIPTHRGKRGIEVNCAPTIVNPQIADVYSGEANPQDSQAISILNTCGPVSILGGTLVAGSENLLLAGDTLKVTDCPEGVVTDVLADDVTFSKPDVWRTAQTRVAPKNVVEIKAGVRVTIRRSRIAGSYRAVSTALAGSTQDGSCIVITPRNGQRIADVLFENNVIDRCAQGAQLMGRDVATTPVTTGVVFRGNTWTIDGVTYNGRGILALVVGGMGNVLWENETVLISGTALFLVDSQTPTGPFTVRASRMTTGRLAVAAPGVNYGGPTPLPYAGREFTFTAEGNVFADAPSQFKGFYPKNTWTTRAALFGARRR